MVGKHLLFILLYSFLYNVHLFASVALHVEGVDHYEAIVGETFSIDLIVKGIPKGFTDPSIETIPHVFIQRSGLYMSTINGKSEIRYAYQVYFDKIGSYKLGPVTIISNGRKFQSNELTITVTHQKSTNANNTKQEFFLRLTTDTDTAVVGQAITCTLSCYVKRRGITIERIIPPLVSSGKLVHERKLPQSEEVIDGVQHAVLHWVWQIVPTEEGELVIPAAAIEYTTQGHNKNSFLFSLLSSAPKRLYSNACVVNIVPLPKYQGICHAIGQFSDFSAFLSPTIIKKGEATTITLTLQGSGTFFPVLNYDLDNIPDAIRYYAVDPQQSNNEYVFEYIAQGIKEGAYIIPEQLFTFFNTKTKQYEQLSTTKLELHITENNALTSIQSNETDEDTFSELISDEPPKTQDEPQDAPDIEEEWFNQRSVQPFSSNVTIPWILFFILIFFLFLGKVILVFFSRSLFMQRVAHRMAFKFRVLAAIGRSRRINDMQQLQQLFISLIAFFYQCSESDVYLFISDLDNLVKNQSCEDDSFYNFWESLSCAIYSEQDKKNTKKIYQEAQRWLKQFLKFL